MKIKPDGSFEFPASQRQLASHRCIGRGFARVLVDLLARMALAAAVPPIAQQAYLKAKSQIMGAEAISPARTCTVSVVPGAASDVLWPQPVRHPPPTRR